MILPIALAGGLWWAYGGRTRFGWLSLISAAGVAIHLLYDLVTTWGTMLLYPFSSERFALDWLFIVDLVTWTLPVGVLVVSARRPDRGRAAVVIWLLALVVYGATAAGIHGRAVSAVAESERAGGRQVAEAVAFPRLGAPWRWSAVAVARPEDPEPRIAVYRAHGIPPRAALTERVARRFDDHGWREPSRHVRDRRTSGGRVCPWPTSSDRAVWRSLRSAISGSAARSYQPRRAGLRSRSGFD